MCFEMTLASDVYYIRVLVILRVMVIKIGATEIIRLLF